MLGNAYSLGRQNCRIHKASETGSCAVVNGRLQGLLVTTYYFGIFRDYTSPSPFNSIRSGHNALKKRDGVETRLTLPHPFSKEIKMRCHETITCSTEETNIQPPHRSTRTGLVWVFLKRQKKVTGFRCMHTITTDLFLKDGSCTLYELNLHFHLT